MPCFDSLTYKKLVVEAAKAAFNPCPSSRENQCYGYFRTYYFNHTLNNTPKGKKVAKGKLTLDDVVPLLKFDTRWVKLKQALGYSPKYYYFKQEVMNHIANKKERYFLFLQVDEKSINAVYDVIRIYFDSFFESMYMGFNSIVIIMESPEQLDIFLKALRALKKE